MKPLILLAIFLASMQFLLGQTLNPDYDEELATHLGADDYGMKSYVFVMLKTGTNSSTNEEAKQKAFAGHMSNMKRLAKEDILIVAGPLGKNDQSYRGIFILNVPSIDEALDVLSSDPAIKANYLEPELYEWYGSAALSEYLEASEKVRKFSF